MKQISISDWDRREYYEFFRRKSTQYFSVAFESDVTALRQQAKVLGCSLYLLTIWKVATVVNNYLPLRQRLELDANGCEIVVEHEVVHPLFTVPSENGYFNYCFVDYHSDLAEFLARARELVKAATECKHFATLVPERGDMIFFSGVPNMAFTGVGNFQLPHSYDDLPVTMPMLVWGKIATKAARRIMPLNLVVNHIFCDGRHIGEIQQLLQDKFDEELS
ncbi:MAG: CatA-like O-acetyltransferase [Negativicutes bacterium]|jgi:chloramphenicol O-acetyltransferase